MTITERRNAYRKHHIFHGEVQIEGCKFCFPKADKHAKSFVCSYCNKTFPWSYLHRSSQLKKNQCIICYWGDRPDLRVQSAEKKMLFKK